MVLVSAVSVGLSTGCRTHSAATQRGSAPDFAAQVAALSNEVMRLNKRLEKLEMDSEAVRSFMGFVQKLLDEKRYEPVVQEQLIYVPTDDSARKMTNAPTQESPCSTQQP